MIRNRQLQWDGCTNVRDLGGLSALDGRMTRWGALVRSYHPVRLTSTGWDALCAHGVRTIISLRTEGLPEPEIGRQNLPAGIEVVALAIEDCRDPDFVQKWAETGLWSTPLYYQDALTRWQERHAAVVAAFANAQPGGVLFHCKRGVDRTGIIALLLLSMAGVDAEDIVSDYELSLDPKRDEILRERGTTSRRVVLDTLANLNAESYLLDGGLSEAELLTARERFLEAQP